MRISKKSIIATLSFMSLLWACNQKEELKPLTFTPKELSQKDGIDCEKPDSLRLNCAEIKLKWSELKDGSTELQKNVGNWVNVFLNGIISPSEDETSLKGKSLDASVQEFFKEYKEFAKEAPDSPMTQWSAESKDSTILNDGKYLTLQIEAYTYAGGAHGNPSAVVATFDVKTGKQLTWDDVINDKAALKTLAEKKFMAAKSEAFQEGFKFDDTFKFELPANFGLTSKGIYFYYVHYEVGPYAMGETIFEIPFAELGTNYKLK